MAGVAGVAGPLLLPGVAGVAGVAGTAGVAPCPFLPCCADAVSVDAEANTAALIRIVEMRLVMVVSILSALIAMFFSR